jgi:epoxyqueuosine reductase
MSLADTIKREARSLGFDAVGISRVDDHVHPPELSSHRDSLTQRLYDRLLNWLRRNYHGTMSWMAREPSRRADPRLVLPNCRSVISVGMNYDTGHRAMEGSGFGRVARYAWGKDYHAVLGARLKELESRIQNLAPGANTRSYVDTGPIMEKAWAQESGLGWIGKHSNLVSSEYGSWLLLGEILTTLELATDQPATDLCGSCSLCIRACPTGAIVEPYVVDANRCISYLTIEFRGSREDIPEELASRMGNHVFGCDDCLDICPFNLRGEPSTEPAFLPSPATIAPRLNDLAALDEAAFAQLFDKSPIRRAKHKGFQRNISIAQHNE